ncbi:MAG: hypothetical protein QM764_12795 [Chitinophagaceae bacterium]
MNNFDYTIANNEFQYDMLLSRQRTNKLLWNNEKSDGCIHKSSLLTDYCYSVVEFQTKETLTFNYFPTNANGFVFIINRVTSSKYVQLMMEDKTVIDHFPKKVELYILPANKSFSFTFAPGTVCKTTLLFITNDVLKDYITPSCEKILQNKPFLPFSGIISDNLYSEVCKQSDLFYQHNTPMINTNIIFSLLATLKNFNKLIVKSLSLNASLSHYAVMNSERYAEPRRNAA